MTTQERLYVLNELNKKMNKIIELLEHMASPKESNEPITTFVKANNVENTFAQDRQNEIFKSLDGGAKNGR